MINTIRKKISYQLIIILCVAALTIFLPASIYTLHYVSAFGGFAAKVNEEQIRKQAINYLATINKEKGLHLNSFFEKVRTSAALMASEASRIYGTLDDRQLGKGNSLALYHQSSNNMFITSFEEPIVTLYWGGNTLDEPIRREIEALRQLDNLLLQVNREIPETLATHMITVSGIGRYCTDDLEGKKIAYQLPPTDVFDLRDGAPITIYTKDNLSLDTAHWTPVYKDDVIEGLMVTASGPITDGQGNFMGEIGIDLPLQKLTEELLQFNQPDGQEGSGYFGFITDQTGRFISFPQQHLAPFGLEMDLSSFKHSSDIVEHSLQQSSIAEVRELGAQILANSNSPFPLSIGNERYMVSTYKMEDIGWHLTLLASEESMLQSVQETNQALQDTLQLLKNRLLVYIFTGAIVLVVLLLFVNKRFIRPIVELQDTASEIGQGNLSIECERNRNDEIGGLASSINHMILQLRKGAELKDSYASNLEKQINLRTRDLQQKNRQLEEAVARLDAESKKRQAAVEALKENQQQLRSVTDLSLAGLCIMQDGRFKYANSGLARMLKTDIAGALKMEVLDVVHPDHREYVVEQLLQRSQGEPGFPYAIQLIAADKTAIDVLVEGSRINWQGKPAVVGTVVDITRLKEVENKLRANEVALKHSLEDKEILLKEVYHRTKNNMLVIISLLDLQGDAIEDADAKRIFKETENRIRTMSLMHEQLYNSKSLANINLREYIDQIGTNLMNSMTLDGQIGLRVSSIEAPVSIDKAMPLGLVINEIVTNSIQHAFPGGMGGEISIILEKADSKNLRVTIADNGVGIPEENIEEVFSSFGFQIIFNLIEKQLNGKYVISGDNGTKLSITFSPEDTPV